MACAPGSSSSSNVTTETRPTTPAKLEILSPEPGSTTGSAIILKLQLTGATVVAPTEVTGIDPTEGHIHVSVDGKLVSMAYGLTQPVRGLTPGHPHDPGRVRGVGSSPVRQPGRRHRGLPGPMTADRPVE